MKILYLASSKGVAGSSKALFNLVKGMKSLHEIIVVARIEGLFSETVRNELSVPCYSLPHSHLTIYPDYKTLPDKVKFPYRLVKYLIKRERAYEVLLKIAKQEKPDIIHTNVGPFDIGFRVAKKLGVKHIWHLREYQDLDFDLHFFPTQRNFREKLESSNNYCIAITNDVFKYWNLKKKKDIVIYDGVLDNKQHSIQEKRNYFLFVGRIEEAKGIMDLLEVFSEFTKTNKSYQLLIAGKGERKYLEKCQKIVVDNHIGNLVTFLGHRDDVYRLMGEAKALVVSSCFEGFGFITVEAMFNHCLVIGNNTAGTKEQFDIGLRDSGAEIGLRYEGRIELLQRLKDVSALPTSEYCKITERAYNTVMSNYKIELHAKLVMDFYQQVIDEEYV